MLLTMDATVGSNLRSSRISLTRSTALDGTGMKGTGDVGSGDAFQNRGRWRSSVSAVSLSTEMRAEVVVRWRSLAGRWLLKMVCSPSVT